MALGLADGGCTGALLPAPLAGILTIISESGSGSGSGIGLRAAPLQHFGSIQFDAIRFSRRLFTWRTLNKQKK